MIEVKNITKKFKNIVAVDNVSFSVEKGRCFGLIGRSGSGKTTVGKIILGLCFPDKGEALISGKDISKASERERDKYRKERGVSMVFQHPDATLNPGMTIKRSILEIMKCNSGNGISFQEILEYFDAVGLSKEKLELYSCSLSGGEKRRIALIQALSVKPKILIADELFSGVDSIVRNAMINLLKKAQREKGLTIILIAHNMDIVRYLCDRIGKMEKGELVEVYDGKT